MNSVMKFMPLMFGYFALIVPSGLTLYWFTSNLLAIVQQVFTKSQVASNEAGAAIGSSTPANPMPANPVPANPVVANSAAGNSASVNSGDDQKSVKDGRSKRRKKSRRKR
jgi:YidC/Oxa1 family membrane protein insertase